MSWLNYWFSGRQPFCREFSQEEGAEETQTIPDEKKKEKKQKKEDVDFYHHDPLWDVKCIENVHKSKIDYSTEKTNTPYGSFDNRGSYKNRNKSAIFTQRKKNRFRVKTATTCHRKKLKTKSQIEADTRSFKLTDHRGHEISRGNVEVPVKSQYSKLKTHHRSNAQSNRFIMNSSTTNTSKLRRIKMSFIKTSTPSQKPRKKPYNSSIDCMIKKTWKISYPAFHRKYQKPTEMQMPDLIKFQSEHKRRVKSKSKGNLKKILNKLSKLENEKNKQDYRNKRTPSLVNISVDRQQYEYLGEKYKHVINLNQARLQLPSCVPDEYAKILVEESFEEKYQEIQYDILNRKYKVALSNTQEVLNNLYEIKEKIMHDGEENLNMYKACLINLLLCVFNAFKVVLLIKNVNHKEAEMLAKANIDILRSILTSMNDRKLLQVCKLNLITLIYNWCIILYIYSKKKDCITNLRKLTEMITKDMVLVDDKILKSIYLLKCYCHYYTDPVLANQSAKMVIDLDTQAEEENEDFNAQDINDKDSVQIHLDSQMLKIQSFDNENAGNMEEKSVDGGDIDYSKQILGNDSQDSDDDLLMKRDQSLPPNFSKNELAPMKEAPNSKRSVSKASDNSKDKVHILTTSKSFVQSKTSSRGRKSPNKLKGIIGRKIRLAESRIDTRRKSMILSSKRNRMRKSSGVSKVTSNQPSARNIEEISEEGSPEKRAQAYQFDNELVKSSYIQNELIRSINELRTKLNKHNKLLLNEEDDYTKASNKITRKIKEDTYHLKSLKENQIKTGIHTNLSKVMSEMEVDFINKYFNLCPSDDQILEMIDKIMRGLKFFCRMNKDNRRDIILSSTIKTAEPGEYVIKQGEIGKHMYIILRGCIHIKINMHLKQDLTISHIKKPPILRQIASLYDGDHFGEMALIDLEKQDDISKLSTPKKRKANCIASDNVLLLKIPHAASIKAYQTSSAENMKKRIDFLITLPGFRMIDKNTLLPLVSNMKVKNFKIGEYIIRQREMPMGLIVIYKGECTVGYEKHRKRQFHNNIYTKLKPKEMNSHFSDYNETRYEVTTGFNSKKIKLKVSTNTEGDEQSKPMNKRTFKNDILEKEEDPTGKKTVVYKDFIDFCKIHKGQIFGYRTIMPLEFYIMSKRTDYEREFIKRAEKEEIQKFFNEACVSIVANSAIVETFIFEKALMSFLPEHLSQAFFKDLLNCKEHDRPANIVEKGKNDSIIGSIIKMNKEDDLWDNTKNKIIDKTLKASYIERHKALA
ncbi:unnamed protein product [Moneuplotes crassus]|uniref:Cyclic nucleotide-binding domain-containing protein n=1 Tax=Euplotes crassus TaxID=5936 RepID=A0AAD1XAY8_EUPCR|nr:unnamed protein product [Moneuplotes crassus]